MHRVYLVFDPCRVLLRNRLCLGLAAIVIVETHCAHPRHLIIFFKLNKNVFFLFVKPLDQNGF